jgi:hypothetical protein
MICHDLNPVQCLFPPGEGGAVPFRRMGGDRKPAALWPHQTRETRGEHHPPAPIGPGRPRNRWGVVPYTELAEDPEAMSHNCGCVSSSILTPRMIEK